MLSLDLKRPWRVVREHPIVFCDNICAYLKEYNIILSFLTYQSQGMNADLTACGSLHRSAKFGSLQNSVNGVKPDPVEARYGEHFDLFDFMNNSSKIAAER